MPGPYNLQLTVVINNNEKKEYLYMRAAVIYFLIIQRTKGNRLIIVLGNTQ